MFLRIAIVALLVAAGAAWMLRYDVLPAASMAFILDRWSGQIIICEKAGCVPIEDAMPEPKPTLPPGVTLKNK